jgi:hypothetical protein
MEDVSGNSELLRALSDLRDLYEEFSQINRMLMIYQDKVIVAFRDIVLSALWTRTLKPEEEAKRIRELTGRLAREVIEEVERHLRKYC